ncbi:MAG TPA: OB-fold nucleic acid binding domain-containing protein, partial [Spirochaetia bacterium]|nr:OB-fold nucleic acid binding domain-containing protein [Spirochaetia bacterium]
MVKEKAKFIAGAKAKGFTEKHADEIFEILIPFAGYGFNKSHAAAYSVLAYKTAYLKANFPAEFMAANLTNEIGSPDSFSQYITVTKEMGIDILPPDINLSERNFTVVNGKIVYGLAGVKNVGQAAVEEIIRARSEAGNFTSLSDFLLKVDLRIINRKVIETLILAGLFDSLGVGRATLMANLERILEWVARRKESKKYGQTSLFEGEEETEQPIELVPAEEWPYMELLRLEKENLGFFFSGHPMDKYREIKEKCTNLEIGEIEKAVPDKSYTLLGMIKTNRVILTKAGKKMAFAQFEDNTGSVELVFFSRVWETSGSLVVADAVLGIQGKVEFKQGDPKIIVDKVMKPEEMKDTEPKEVHIRLSRDCLSEEKLYSLRSALIDEQGNCRLFIHLSPSRGETKETVIRASSQITVSSKDAALKSLKNHEGIIEIWRV